MRPRSSSSDKYVQRIIRNKRVSMSCSSPLLLLEEDRVFDELLIFGLPPDPPTAVLRGKKVPTNAVKPELLTFFPSSVHSRTLIEYEQISDFCFPDGFKPVGSGNSKFAIKSAFPFLLTNNSIGKTYCFCIQFIAPASHPPFFSTNYSRRYLFAICMLSKSHMIAPIAEFLTFLVHCVCGDVVPMQIPEYESKVPKVSGFCIEGMKYDLKYPTFAVSSNISVSKTFVNEVHYFYSTQVRSGRMQDIVLSSKYTITFPATRDNAHLLAFPSIHCLISLLSPMNIVKLFTALLLDYHVVLYSKYPSRSALCVLAAVGILSPFEYRNTIIPILPNTYTDILGSPTPYIVGMCSMYDAEVFVNLDNDTIRSHDIPSLPGAADLARKLKLVMESSVSAENNPLVLPSVYQEIDPPKIKPSLFLIDSILSIFKNHLSPRLSADLHPFFVTDRSEKIPITVLNTELFLDSVKLEEKPFYTQFALTQAFDDFVSKITDTYSNLTENALGQGIQTNF